MFFEKTVSPRELDLGQKKLGSRGKDSGSVYLCIVVNKGMALHVWFENGTNQLQVHLFVPFRRSLSYTECISLR